MAKVLLVAAALTSGAACGSGATSHAGSTGKPSTSVSKHAGFLSMDTNLRVVNQSGRDLVANICHDGYCNDATLREGEGIETAGTDITGWVKSAWGFGNGSEQNPFNGTRGNARGPYQINFSAGNPTVGLPWIEASLPNTCRQGIVRSDSGVQSGYRFKAHWSLDVGDYLQSPRSSLCTYSMIAKRQGDVGDYKKLILFVYAPDRGSSCWEQTPGPVRVGSPDGSWSCWPEGPKPPADVPSTPAVPG